MKEAYIVSSVRTAIGKAKRGTLRNARPEDLGATAVRGALDRVPEITGDEIDDVLIGCAMPEGEQGMNMGRLIALNAGIPNTASAATVNRFCSSGLQTIVMGVQSIRSGFTNVVVAGGAESMSLVPMTGFYFRPAPSLMEKLPESYVGMGITAENVAKKYEVSREDQDRFSYQSHLKALDAIKNGRFEEEIVPHHIHEVVAANGATKTIDFDFKVDEGPRADTTIEALGALRPAFSVRGTVTAGNSSQMSDGGAAAVLVSEDVLKEKNLKPMARIVGFATAGVPPELMGIGPIDAIKKVLKQTGLSLNDIGLVELNEAFASQSLAVIKTLDIDESIVNVNGGAIALGHPLGCTGAKLTATLLHEMKRRKIKYGICTMCIGGGMGAAGILENLSL